MATKGYQELLNWLFNIRRLGPDRTLDPIRLLTERLGNPQNSFRSIHVTGTNGKGSTSAMIASILRAEGYRVGLYTSPHLERFTERIVVDGDEISEVDVVRLLSQIREIVDDLYKREPKSRPLFFDIVTALAFKYFEECAIDIAVLEVGMGGRLDATNIVHSLVSVITNVSLEHTKVLGDTVLMIAYEKSGIIKLNSILVTATQDDKVYNLFRDTCMKLNCKIYRVGTDIDFRLINGNISGQNFLVKGLRGTYRLFIPLLGSHQLSNAATAVGVVEALSFYNINVSEAAISMGLKHVRWPGRLEVMQENPLVLLDCAKDSEAMRALAESLKGIPHRRVIAVISISSDKNIPEMISHLETVVDYFIVTSHTVMGRAAERELIGGEISKRRKPWESIAKVSSAVQRAFEIAEEEDMIIVTGSLFAVGEARQRWEASDSSL